MQILLPWFLDTFLEFRCKSYYQDFWGSWAQNLKEMQWEVQNKKEMQWEVQNLKEMQWPNFIYCVNPIARIFDGLEP